MQRVSKPKFGGEMKVKNWDALCSIMGISLKSLIACYVYFELKDNLTDKTVLNIGEMGDINIPTSANDYLAI